MGLIESLDEKIRHTLDTLKVGIVEYWWVWMPSLGFLLVIGGLVAGMRPSAPAPAPVVAACAPCPACAPCSLCLHCESARREDADVEPDALAVPESDKVKIDRAQARFEKQESKKDPSTYDFRAWRAVDELHCWTGNSLRVCHATPIVVVDSGRSIRDFVSFACSETECAWVEP